MDSSKVYSILYKFSNSMGYSIYTKILCHTSRCLRYYEGVKGDVINIKDAVYRGDLCLIIQVVTCRVVNMNYINNQYKDVLEVLRDD
jgi:hypothetical protein